MNIVSLSVKADSGTVSIDIQNTEMLYEQLNGGGNRFRAIAAEILATHLREYLPAYINSLDKEAALVSGIITDSKLTKENEND